MFSGSANVANSNHHHRTEPAAVRPRRKMKSLPRDGVGIHKRAVRRARDSEERAVDDGGRGFVYGESGRRAKARGIRRVDMLRPVREDWLQTEDIEHVQRVDGLGTEHELNFFNFALRRQSRPRELHAHVPPIGTPATTMPQPRILRSLRPGVFATFSWVPIRSVPSTSRYATPRGNFSRMTPSPSSTRSRGRPGSPRRSNASSRE